MAEASVPTYYDLLWPTLQSVIHMGGSARLDEIAQAVIERQGYSEAQQAIFHGDGPQTEIEYRLAWARTYLKGMGLLENSARGVWSVTEAGRNGASDPSRAPRRLNRRRTTVSRNRNTERLPALYVPRRPRPLLSPI